ncbi:hypothetical protein [Micromonospora tarensis]|uniref:Lipoprotein n=1 Tax=Micromonospora tarensis TaxID=2806100 RepID=A0ABS1YL82_9ACTN|nr:hypothetical protein [Micromonospora tarensis]MBM0278068.1 hypothetical protein [Micromonospora tarensis]
MTRSRRVRAALVGVLASAVLLGITACTEQADTPAPAAAAQPSPSAVAMRIDKPAKLLGTWTESVFRPRRDAAERSMGNLRKLLSTETTSAMGTAYVRAEEVYSEELGLHIPHDDQRAILISAVSGTITDPTATLEKLFAGLPNVTDVGPILPGPLGGAAACGTGQGNPAIRVDVCGWSDDHTVGMVTLFGFAESDDPHGVFGQIRAEVEHSAR